MTIPDTYDDLEIVGATPGLEDEIAPHRLNPVYRRRGSPDVYYTLAAEEDAGPPQLATIAYAELEALLADGDAVLFEHPIQAQPAHVLIYMHPGQQPEYFPLEDLPIRRRRAASETITRAARELATGDRSKAESLVWYARRADPDDPLPLLVLTLLLRADPDVELLHGDLLQYSSAAVDASRERLRRNPGWASLLNEDARIVPGSRASTAQLMPDYLRPYAHRPEFLQKARFRLERQSTPPVAA